MFFSIRSVMVVSLKLILNCQYFVQKYTPFIFYTARNSSGLKYFKNPSHKNFESIPTIFCYVRDTGSESVCYSNSCALSPNRLVHVALFNSTICIIFLMTLLSPLLELGLLKF